MAKRKTSKEQGAELIGSMERVTAYLREHGHELGPKNRKQRKAAQKAMREFNKLRRRRAQEEKRKQSA